jgi:glycosyltransferase involved in cell wall biosynthesis
MSNLTRTKVLFLITKSNWGGAQRYVYDLATSLDTTRFEPVVVLGGTGALVDRLQQAGVRTITLTSLQRNISVRKELQLVVELWRAVRAERPDVLHVNSSKAGGIGCLIGRLARVPRVVFTAHGWAFNEDRPAWQRVVIKAAHWLTVLLSHRTIAVSRAIVEQMNWPLAQGKMTVINPGRTIPTFHSRLAARTVIVQAHPPLAAYTADVWLMIVAELHPIKQHERLLAALESITINYPRVRLVCIGTGERQAYLQTYIEKHGLTDHVFLVGQLPEAATILKAADLFVLPSASESYGYVLHEAGLARVPIIASRVGGITDIIESADEGTLIDSTNPSELTDAINDFLHWPDRYTNRTAALQTKLAIRSVAAMTTATRAVYHQ